MPKIYEYRGVSGLKAAPVLTDDTSGMTFGDVIDIAGVSEISKEVDSTNEAHYYDNMAAVVISSTGADTITINTSAIPDDVLAKITGMVYDTSRAMLVEQERVPGYWALGYITKDTSGHERFVWRLKGTFNMPGETNQTENDGTDANGQEVVFTGVSTIHKFTLTGKPAKAITVNTAENPVDAATFFGTVQTPDTIQPVTPPVVTGIGVAPSTASIAVDETIALTATLYPAGAQGTITWASSDSTYASVDDNGVVTGVAAGSATITATCGSYSDSCVVTVTA